MYKVFVVDDENMVIKSFTATLNWSDYDFEIVGFALSGTEAMDRIRHIKPDIVFTDIRMPGISGLELIKTLSAELKDTYFIIISGYAEFAYAQKALNYGAFGYCLKPFDENEIAGYLKKVKALLDKKNNPAELDILDLVMENTDAAKQELFSLLSTANIDPQCLSVMVSLGKDRLDLSNITDCLTFKTGFEKNAYLLNLRQTDPEDIKSQILHRQINGVGISRKVNARDDLTPAILEAELNACGYFVTGKKHRLFLHRDSTGSNRFVTQFQNALNEKDLLAASKILGEIKDGLENNCVSMKHLVIIYNIVILYVNKSRSDKLDGIITNYADLTKMFHGGAELLGYLKGLLFQTTNLPVNLYSAVPNQSFGKILEYVKMNFNQDISLRSISEKFYINPNYVSQLFKKETGITFTEYLSNLRINIASDLLESTDAPVARVAEKVGYGDYFYFSRIFKKIKGDPPSRYRAKFLAYRERSAPR